jgi:hypothetical protein
MEANLKHFYRMVQLKGGVSASYLSNNLIKSDTFVAFIKNGFTRSMITIYKTSELENDVLSSDLINS